MVHCIQNSLEEEIREKGALAAYVIEANWIWRRTHQSINLLRLGDSAYPSLPFEFELDRRPTPRVDSRGWDTKDSRFTRHRSSRTDD